MKLILKYPCVFESNVLELEYKWWKVVRSGRKWWESGLISPCCQYMQVISMFMGEYNHTVDAKGRLIVPSKFREQLGEEFVVTKGLDGCLFVYDNDEWRALEEKLKSLPLTNTNARKFSRFFLAGASSCEVDKQGRILLPAVLREHAGIDKDAVLVGVGSRIEIWSKDAWTAANTYDDMEEIAEAMEGLGI